MILNTFVDDVLVINKHLYKPSTKALKKKKKKKHWVDFYHYRVVVYTHCQHTFQFKQHVKVHFESEILFKVKTP